jgi:predicted Zn finger-like uncharacterized protein
MANPKISCPNCKSTFRVPANALGTEGRKLRCSSCKHEWHAMIYELQHDEELPKTTFVEELLTPPKQNFVDELLASPVQNENWLVEEAKIDEKPAPEQIVAEPKAKEEIKYNPLDDYILGAGKTAATVAQQMIADEQNDAETEEETEDSSISDAEFAKLFAETKPQPQAKPTKISTTPFYGNVYVLLTANLLMFALLVFGLLLANRDMVIAKLPESSAFYRMIGYQQTSHLQLADVSFSSSKTSDNNWRYVVKGKIINKAKHVSLVPTIRARIFDKRGNMIEQWQLASDDNHTSDYTIPVEGEKIFSLKLPAKGNAAMILAVDIGSNMELALRK